MNQTWKVAEIIWISNQTPQGLNLVYTLASYVTLGKSFNISISVSLSEN